MMTIGFGMGVFKLCQYGGYIKIKNSEGMDESELVFKKKISLVASLAMFGICAVYTFEFLGYW